MKKTTTIIALAVITLFSACTGPTPEGNVIIEGKFPAFANQQVVLSRMEVYKAVALDTLGIDEEGLFKAGVTVEQPEFFLLKFDNKNYITLLVGPGENIEVASPGMIRNYDYTVAGSSGSARIHDMEDFLESHRKRLDSIRNIYQGVGARGQFTHPAVTREFEKSLTEIREKIREMVMDDPSSLSSLLFLNKRFGQEKLFRETEDYEIFRHVDSALAQKYPGNVHVADHHERVARATQMIEAGKRADERLAPGRLAPDFTMESYRGREVSLSDLRGKVVLLYFWASWDAASRQANKSLKEIYGRNQNKGFEIMAVSLDSYEEMWRNAIELDSLDWINVTDLQNIYSAPVFLYQVPEDIPFYYLIDKDQQIAWKGEDIEELKKRLGPLLRN